MIADRRDEENPSTPSGHVTSISVLRSYRRLGLAAKLMRQSRTFIKARGSRTFALLIELSFVLVRACHVEPLQCITYHLTCQGEQ